MDEQQWQLHLYKQVGWAKPVWVSDARPCSLACMWALEVWADGYRGWEAVRGKLRLVQFRVVMPLLLMWLACSPAQAWSNVYILQETTPFYGSAINSKGAMAGQWCDGTGCYPALWRSPDDIEILSERVGAAWSLNDSGGVVYEGEDEDGQPGGWYWSPKTGSVRLSLGDTGYEQAIPLKINNKQQIVGVLQFFFASGACPARWASPTAAPECLAMASNAGHQALNQKGVSSGFWQGDLHGTDMAFRYAPKTGLEEIPFGVPVAINDKNVVLYQGSYSLLPDGTLVGQVELPGCGEAIGTDINNARWIIGRSPCAEGMRGWLQVPGVGVIDLMTAVGEPGWAIEFPFGLNAKGQIVAWSTFDGILRGVKLTPALLARTRP